MDKSGLTWTDILTGQFYTEPDDLKTQLSFINSRSLTIVEWHARLGSEHGY